MALTIEEDLLARIDTLILWQPFVARVNSTLNACASRGRRYVGIDVDPDWVTLADRRIRHAEGIVATTARQTSFL